MCRAFSCIVTKKGEVIWQTGKDFHDKLLEMVDIRDDTTDGDCIKFAKIEITPNKGYLYPEGKWTFRVDQNTPPRWLTPSKRKACWDAFEEWKQQIYSRIDLEKARNPVHPFNLPKRTPTKADIELLKRWASIGTSIETSVRASVWNSIWDSVGDSVRAAIRTSVGDSVKEAVRASIGDSVWYSVEDSVEDSVWNSIRASVRASIWAVTGSYFVGITDWKYVPQTEGYPFQPVVDLWNKGLVASYDGKKWRLHSGRKAKTVWEGEIK